VADKQLVADLRKEYDELVEVLEGDGFCIRRECMCDHAKPVVKMNDLITKLEQAAS
jgi:hypothetical protein